MDQKEPYGSFQVGDIIRYSKQNITDYWNREVPIKSSLKEQAIFKEELRMIEMGIKEGIDYRIARIFKNNSHDSYRPIIIVVNGNEHLVNGLFFFNPKSLN